MLVNQAAGAGESGGTIERFTGTLSIPSLNTSSDTARSITIPFVADYILVYASLLSAAPSTFPLKYVNAFGKGDTYWTGVSNAYVKRVDSGNNTTVSAYSTGSAVILYIDAVKFKE